MDYNIPRLLAAFIVICTVMIFILPWPFWREPDAKTEAYHHEAGEPWSI
jgi:hypothetical protein